MNNTIDNDKYLLVYRDHNGHRHIIEFTTFGEAYNEYDRVLTQSGDTLQAAIFTKTIWNNNHANRR